MTAAERYADQRAHDVANMTAAEREAYSARLAEVDASVRTVTVPIAVLSPDNGDGTATVVTMTYSVAPKPGQVIAEHGESVVTVRRDPPPGAGMQWVAPLAVNCGRCGLVTCAREGYLAELAADAHIAAGHQS